MVPLHVSMDRPRKTSRGHIRRPKPAIYEASVSVDTMADISESIDVRRSDGSMRIGKRFVSQPIAGSISGATQLSARRRTYQRSRRMPRACRKHAMGYGRRGRRDASSHSPSPYNLNYRKAKQPNTRRSQQNVRGLLLLPTKL
jgi:hypothetical protein